MSIERYREDYSGEFVITKTTFKNGKKVQEREWIDNPITNSHFSNKATCIGLSHIFNDLFYKQVQRNNGGVLAREKMQVYGVEHVYTKLQPNFLIAQNREILPELIETKYTEKTICYSSPANCIKYPGEFYLLPYSISMNSHALAAWMACFDNHNEIYLVGYEQFDKEGKTQSKIIGGVSDVMKAYSNKKFIHVTDTKSPDAWRKYLNFDMMSIRDYISYCDI